MMTKGKNNKKMDKKKPLRTKKEKKQDKRDKKVEKEDKISVHKIN